MHSSRELAGMSTNDMIVLTVTAANSWQGILSTFYVFIDLKLSHLFYLSLSATY